MRILVIGAGALGGYFGGCLLRAGRDVTFMVRSHRAEQLARDGLRIVSPHGNFTVQAPTVLAGDIRHPVDLVLVAVKSYSLDEAMDEFAPAVGSDTTILPILNGMAHIDTLSIRFGADHVLGGAALISATLDTEGRIVQLLPGHKLTFGEVPGGSSKRTRALMAILEGAGFDVAASDSVMQDMWEKWVGLATVAGITCLMRASTGDILAAHGGQETMVGLFRECSSVAEANGCAPRSPYIDLAMGMLNTVGSPFKASMLRDIERGSITEGEHVLGDMVARARVTGIPTPVLELARVHVAAYEIYRSRTASQLQSDR